MLDKDNYSTEKISNEIRELIQNADTVVAQKDMFMDMLKQLFLSTSTNN